MESESQFRLSNFADVLAKTSRPLPRDVRESLIAFLRADAIRVGVAFRSAAHREFLKAAAEVTRLRARLDEHRPWLEEMRKEFRTLPDGRWFMGGFSLLCFIAVLFAEYALNLAVVPWLVSVSRRSIAGMALALAPAMVPVILDRVVLALFDVHDSWDALKAAILSPVGRLARGVVRISFFLAVGWLNIHAIWLIATTRGVASFLRNSGAVSIDAVQQGRIDAALIWLSVALCIDGAGYYLFAMHDLHRACDKRRARIRLEKLQQIQEAYEKEYGAAQTELKEKERAWKDIDPLQGSVLEAYIAEGRVMLEEFASQPVDPRQVVGKKLVPLSAVSAARKI